MYTWMFIYNDNNVPSFTNDPIMISIDNLYLRYEHNSSSSYTHFTIQTRYVMHNTQCN